MRKSLLALGFAFALTLSSAAISVGMGGIIVSSGLGQPLKAEIELVAVSKAEKASLVARLAPPDVYKESGLDYPYGNKFSFQIENRANGEPYLKVRSDQPISDPFVIMLVELSWSAGKLVREYTFLLDPPGYIPDQPAQAPVQAVAPAIESVPPVVTVKPLEQVPPTETTAIPQAEQTVSTGQAAAAGQPDQEAAWLQDDRSRFAAAPAEQPAQEPVPAPGGKPVEAAAEDLPDLDEFIVIKRGDTLREVAERYRLTDMSLDRMLVALYRVNADRFEGRNMNRIKAGKVLRLPHEREVEAVSQSDAVREIRAQTADWNVYRQKLASTAMPVKQIQEAQQIATGRISSSVADMAPVAKETAKEVLKLSRGEAPGDGTLAGAGGKVASAADKKNAEQEEAIARSKALKDQQDREARLAQNLKEMQRLAELKAPIAAPAEPAKVAASGVAAATTAEKPKPKPLPKPKVVEPEPLMDQVMSGANRILEEPVYLGGGALALLGLASLVFMRKRQKKKSFNESLGEPWEAGEAGGETSAGRLAAPVVPSPDTGDFTRMGETSGAAVESENIDPIGEAELFLNFGRDAQAEEILKEALQSTPNDHRIHLKLLGIYANRADTGSFSAIARQLRDSGDAEAWQQAAAMGRKLEPNNPMYGGSGAAEVTGSATAVFAPQVTVSGNEAVAAPAPVLDFDIDLGSFAAKAAPSTEPDLQGGGAGSAAMSFDVMEPSQAPAMDFNVAPDQTPAMDFDIAAGHDEGIKAEAPLPDTGDMIFDVMGSFAPTPVEQPAAKPASAEEGVMEFTLDFPVEKPAEAAPDVQMAAIGLEGINLRFDEEGGQPQAEGKDEHWQEVATKLDLAKAYQEMGDAGGAREILDEVLREGDAEQRQAAQALLNQLG